MRYTIYAGSYFGIPVRIHVTFPLILAVFGVEAWIDGGWTDAIRAVVLILAVFVCVVLHEFGHSLQVKRYGITVKDVVLLPIGGMARAERIPEKPRQEIVVAISGPLVNFGLAAILYVVVRALDRPLILEDDFLTSLFAINVVLGTFNLIPAYPMDGGRILRGLLAIRFPYVRATRYAKNVGQLIALSFVVIGFVDNAFIMLPVIAVFIYFGAINEEHMIRVRVAFGDKRVRDLVTVDQPRLWMNDAVDRAAGLIDPGAPAAYAVVDGFGTAFGIVTRDGVTEAMQRGDGAAPLSSIAVLDLPVLYAAMPAAQAYYFLKAEKQPVAGVIDGGTFVGLLFYDRFDSLLKTSG
jgi:stage IV sporulation protein FB